MLANTGAQRVGLNARFLCYVGGKTVSYALLGAMVGLVGAWIEVVQEGASILAWVAGIAMIMVGGHLLGWPGLALFDPPAASSGFVARFARMLKKDSVMSRLGGGLRRFHAQKRLVSGKKRPSRSGSALVRVGRK